MAEDEREDRSESGDEDVSFETVDSSDEPETATGDDESSRAASEGESEGGETDEEVADAESTGESGTDESEDRSGTDEVYCPSCGEAIKADAPACPHCGAEQTEASATREEEPATEVGTTQETAQEASTTQETAQETEPTEKDPGIAALASLLIPGVGDMYNGEVTRGIIVLVAYIGIWIAWTVVLFLVTTVISLVTLGLGVILFLLWPLPLLCHPVSAYLSYSQAQKINAGKIQV